METSEETSRQYIFRIIHLDCFYNQGWSIKNRGCFKKTYFDQPCLQLTPLTKLTKKTHKAQ